MPDDHPAAVAEAILDNVERVIIGKRHVIERTLIGLICGGHVLFEDVPGVGKTMLARAFATSIGCTFKRLQFTPDLLPSDVTGVSIYNQKTGQFEFRAGPVFANIVLADEINRSSPRTQSSLLESMEERQVTVDGVTHTLPSPFLVIATENPIEYEGIYPLPESQLDRFLMRLTIGYPGREDEKTVVKDQAVQHPIESLKAVVGIAEVDKLVQAAKQVHVSEPIYEYMLDIVRATRQRDNVRLGTSPRGSLGLIHAGRALAMLRGRDFVLPDDLKELAPAVLAHRLILSSEARLSGLDPRTVIEEILDETPIPEA
ncbi:MAG: AAA family ATPase [Armatimonadota bacterium]